MWWDGSLHPGARARRSLATATEEFDNIRSTKLQMMQSVDALFERLSSVESRVRAPGPSIQETLCIVAYLPWVVVVAALLPVTFTFPSNSHSPTTPIARCTSAARFHGRLQ